LERRAKSFFKYHLEGYIMSEAESGYEMIRQVAEREVSSLHLLEYGRVESVNVHGSEDDRVGYTCSVLLVGRTTEGGENLKIENVPISTGWTGSINVPYVDDLVLVAFINGDFALPVIIGRMYSREKLPPLFEDGQHLLEISKDPSNLSEVPKLDIKFVDGDQTTINLRESSIEISVGELKVSLIAGEKIELAAGSTKLVINQDGDVEIETPSNLNIKADSNLDLEASGTMTIKGAKVDLNP